MIAFMWLAIAGAQELPRASHDTTDAAANRRAERVLDSLVARARSANPELRAARARTDAAEARIAPAAARPDPMLMAGLQNVPVDGSGFGEPMTMKMIGVSQHFPLGGKLAARRNAARFTAEASRHDADAVSLRVARDVRSAYYELAYIDRALRIVERTRDVLASLVAATQARYEVSATGQQDVIRSRLEVTRLGDDASMLREQRRAVLARLEALLDAPLPSELRDARVPERVARAGVGEVLDRITFVSAALGSRAAGSLLPPLDSLERMALRQNPGLLAREAMVSAQEARADLARRERRPDVDVSLQYGQRDGFGDMLTAVISVPLQVQRGRRQDALLAAERADLDAAQLELDQARAVLRADIARTHAEMERARTHLALAAKALLPQGRASLESAIASYQAGRSEFITVMDAQAALFNIETSYFRALTDFATQLADLERLVGGEGVLP